MNNETRWRQRFENFEKSFHVFQRRIDEHREHPQEEAYQMALVQSFKITMELSWKTLKDYLENEGSKVADVPKSTIREAFRAEIISDAENWMDAVDYRNKTPHIYNENVLNETIDFIQGKFYPLVRDLYFYFAKEHGGASATGLKQ